MVANLHEKILAEEHNAWATPAAALPCGLSADEGLQDAFPFSGQELSLVRTLARVLEPPDMAREGVERAMFVRPASTGAACGDFCDAFPLDNGSLALIVGDVSGHGPQAAAFVPEMRAMLRLALYSDPDPAAALSSLNTALCRSASHRESDITPFVCASIAVLHPNNGLGIFACAGAEPPMIVSTTAMHRSVRVGGVPLGLFMDAEYTAAQRILSASDLLIMGTNGIFDAGRPYRPLGPERLLKWANGLFPIHSLRVIGQMLMDEIQSFAMGNIPDDSALLLARLL